VAAAVGEVRLGIVERMVERIVVTGRPRVYLGNIQRWEKRKRKQERAQMD
jgi:hypothetical protein